jgi:hypothetical protein
MIARKVREMEGGRTHMGKNIKYDQLSGVMEPGGKSLQ